METLYLRDLVEFSTEEPLHRGVFETERLWSEIVCLERTQRYGPVTDPASDALVTVVAGEVVIQVDRGRKRAHQWETALVPAESNVTVTNASTDPAVILIVA